MEINRKKVSQSMWIPVPTVLIFVILLGILEGLFNPAKMDIVEIVFAASVLMLIGAIVWIPSALCCLLIERLSIKKHTTKKELKGLLVVEAMIPVVLFLVMANHITILGTLVPIVFALGAQLVRWSFLNHKNRLHIQN